MEDYFYYCPICGKMIIDITATICPHCKKHISACRSVHNISYYQEKAMEQYGSLSYSRQVLKDEEAHKNPLFNPRIMQQVEESEFNQIQVNILRQKMSNETEKVENNVPKCPTCSSTNIKKISTASKVIGGAMWGLFSKTARSQFECLNCRYKW